MWSLFLGTPRPCHILIPKSFKVLVPSLSATTPTISLSRRRHSKPLPNDGVPSTQQVGDLGHTLFANLQSNSNSNQQQPKQDGEGLQIRGSDVLWALRRATARKEKKKQQRREPSSSVGSRREGSVVDCSNVRPLCINSEWGAKLDELEKRLRELSETI